MKLVTVEEMREIEKEADASGLSYAVMMENAGYNLAQQVLELASTDEPDEVVQVLGLVGSGNNGGDTLIALERLAEKGWIARAYLVKRKRDDPLVSRVEKAGGEVFVVDDDPEFLQLRVFLETTDVVLDGVIGVGFKLPLKADVASILAIVRDTILHDGNPPLVVAVDCPSGVNCDTGEVANEVIPADITITMAAVKIGLLGPAAYKLTGEVRVIDIGEIKRLKSWTSVKNEVADEETIREYLPERPVDAYKGLFGTALVVAGSLNYSGAAILAAKAAARIGVGLVTIALPASLHTALAGHFLEATWILLPHEMGVISSAAADVLARNIERATAILIGPGLGLEETTREFLEKTLTNKVNSPSMGRRMGFLPTDNKKTETPGGGIPPLVVDADGLKLLAKIDDWNKMLPEGTILTPHPGEMSILTGLSTADIQLDRLSIARKYAAEWGHIVVLKGAFTVIAAPDGRSVTIPIATAALSHAGTGDVLAGLIVGLRAQNVDAFRAAVAGAWIHAQAGVYMANIMGDSASVLAGDILESIPEILGGFKIQH